MEQEELHEEMTGEDSFLNDNEYWTFQIADSARGAISTGNFQFRSIRSLAHYMSQIKWHTEPPPYEYVTLARVTEKYLPQKGPNHQD